MAYVSLPMPKAATSMAPLSLSNPPAPSIAHPSASRVASARTRISCTPWSLSEAAMAYVSLPILNASIPRAPLSAAKPSAPSEAYPSASRVPSACTCTTCTPSSLSAATAAYVVPPISNATTPAAPASSAKPSAPSEAYPSASSVPFSCTRISCTPSSAMDATRANVLLPTLNASIPRAASRFAKPGALSAAHPPGETRPFPSIRTSCTPSSVIDATIAYALPFMVNVSMECGSSSSAKPGDPSVADAPAAGASAARAPLSRTRTICTPSSAAEATAAYVAPPPPPGAATDTTATSMAPPSALNPEPSVAEPAAASTGSAVPWIPMFLESDSESGTGRSRIPVMFDRSLIAPPFRCRADSPAYPRSAA